MNFFARRRKLAADTSALGKTMIALRLDQGDVVPAPCTLLRFNAAGQGRRLRAGRVGKEEGENVFGFHPGPFEIDLAPFAQAPEWGLRLRFLIDAANPRLEQQRFDLYLYSEVGQQLDVAEFRDGVQAALRQALAQGSVELPPCTALDEWNKFRAGLNQLLYTRFGVIVDDCLPIDLGEQIDYAAILRERALCAAPPAAEALARATGVETAAMHQIPGAHSAHPACPATADACSMAPAGHAVAPTAGAPAVAQAGARREPMLGPAAGPHPAAAGSYSASGAHPAAAGSHSAAGAHPAPAGVHSAAASSHPAAAGAVHAGAYSGGGIAGPRGAAPSAHPGACAAANIRQGAVAAGAAGPQADARALRRLFLELPALTGGLRQLRWPPGLALFRQQQELMQRLYLASLDVATMPSLAWAGPDQPLPAARQERRIRHSMAAASALDEGWALLARLQLASPDAWTLLLDDADRICANLEQHLAERRTAIAHPGHSRKEPAL